jgi:hypothetical protein
MLKLRLQAMRKLDQLSFLGRVAIDLLVNIGDLIKLKSEGLSPANASISGLF